MKFLSKVSLFILIFTLFGFTNPFISHAQEDLTITTLNLDTIEDAEVIITWRTNIPARYTFEYGTTDAYGYVLHGSEERVDHELLLTNLESETEYHFRITAYNDEQRIVSFDQTFTTTEQVDDVKPELIDLDTIYITDTSFSFMLRVSENVTSYITIWQTNNPSTVATYAQASHYNAAFDTHHVIRTIWNLTPNTTYSYRIDSYDDDGNALLLSERTFTTESNFFKLPEFAIINVAPVDGNSPLITEDAITVEFNTTRPAFCEVRYREGTTGGTTNIAPTIEQLWSRSITIDNLKPGTLYQYQVFCIETFGQNLFSPIYPFVTKGVSPDTPVVTPQFTDQGTTFADGEYRLVRAEESEQIYALVDQFKHYIRNPHIFEDYGFSWSEVETISQAELDTYEPLRIARWPTADNMYYLYLDKGMKKWIPSHEVYNSYELNQGTLGVSLSILDFEYFKNLELMKTPNSATVYYFKDHQKQAIASWADFIDNGWEAWEIGEVNQTDIDYYHNATLL